MSQGGSGCDEEGSLDVMATIPSQLYGVRGDACLQLGLRQMAFVKGVGPGSALCLLDEGEGCIRDGDKIGGGETEKEFEASGRIWSCSIDLT
jgi:hypothetical protein